MYQLNPQLRKENKFMAKHKITQNINKDVGLLDMPKVHVPHSQWETKFSNYLSCNIGDIVPVYIDEVMPSEKRKITMGMLSHMTTPIAPIFNAQYTEFRAFFVPHRLSADLLAGYKTRKSPWVKVFGEDNASANAQVVVPLTQQKLPDVTTQTATDLAGASFNAFGGLADALDMDIDIPYDTDANKAAKIAFYKHCNFLNLAAYELIYQKAYRNQNRESATESALYRFLFDAYNRNSSVSFSDLFHKAQREKDYFTGSQPFTQKGDPITAPLVGDAPLYAINEGQLPNNGAYTLGLNGSSPGGTKRNIGDKNAINVVAEGEVSEEEGVFFNNFAYGIKAVADLSQASGINIESLRLMIKTQELLEKDMMYGSDYASSLNAHFGTAPISLILDEPLELKKVTITSQMQAIFQTSSTASESTILGTIGANATTQSGEFEIVPMTEFKEWGYLIICAVHKAQNSYDAVQYKSKHIYKKSRFDYFTYELDDLGYQKVAGDEFNPAENGLEDAVSYNEAFAEYRFKFNKVHGMFEPTRANALDYWTLAISNYDDIESLYKQGTTELDRAISIKSNVAPQFFDAFGFVEINSKPMKLHSIPGFDGVI